MNRGKRKEWEVKKGHQGNKENKGGIKGRKERGKGKEETIGEPD